MKKLAKQIWVSINGKKTISGIVISVIGVIMFNYQYTKEAAPIVLSFGLGTLGFGAGHKFIKYRQNNGKDKTINN